MLIPRLKRWIAGRSSSVEISEAQGVRTLHLGGDAIQSAMRLSNPEALELHYTRAMMGFLLLVPDPRDVLLVGLGGGSMARFIRRHFPPARITAVEINASVIAAARAWFGLPQDDERLRVINDDGATFVPAHPGCCDVLLLDAFNDGEAVRKLSTRRYYEHCFAALRPGGVFVQNFMTDDPRLDVHLQRLQQVSGSNLLQLPATNFVNTIAFALKRDPQPFRLELLERRAALLERRLGLSYRAMLRTLTKRNAETGLIEG